MDPSAGSKETTMAETNLIFEVFCFFPDAFGFAFNRGSQIKFAVSRCRDGEASFVQDVFRGSRGRQATNTTMLISFHWGVKVRL